MNAERARKKRTEGNPPVAEKSDFARRVIAARTLRGWDQRELKRRYAAEGVRRGRQLGVVEGTIGEWEKSARDPHPAPHQMDALRVVLGADEAWFETDLDRLLGGSVLELPDDGAHLSNPSGTEETRPDTANGQAVEEGSG